MIEEALAPIRELHKPRVTLDGLIVCQGCEVVGMDWYGPAWPCRTALLVYAESEIDAITARERA